MKGSPIASRRAKATKAVCPIDRGAVVVVEQVHNVAQRVEPGGGQV